MCLGNWRFPLGVGGKRVVGVIWGHHRGIGLLWLHWGWVASFWVAGGVNGVSVGMRSCGLFGGGWVLQSAGGYLGLALVFLWDGAMQRRFNCFFSWVFC